MEPIPMFENAAVKITVYPPEFKLRKLSDLPSVSMDVFVPATGEKRVLHFKVESKEQWGATLEPVAVQRLVGNWFIQLLAKHGLAVREDHSGQCFGSPEYDPALDLGRMLMEQRYRHYRRDGEGTLRAEQEQGLSLTLSNEDINFSAYKPRAAGERRAPWYDDGINTLFKGELVFKGVTLEFAVSAAQVRGVTLHEDNILASELEGEILRLFPFLEGLISIDPASLKGTTLATGLTPEITSTNTATTDALYEGIREQINDIAYKAFQQAFYKDYKPEEFHKNVMEVLKSAQAL